MKSEIPMWRPGTGHTFYDNNREDYFAWVVAQPSSLIEGTLEINGSVTKLKGEGYHDHNWGNIEMNKVVEHWYWGRAKVGDYNIITSDLVTADAYGNYRLPVIMIANKGKIIPVPMEETSVKRKDHTEHDKTGKFMDNQIIFTQPASDGKVYTIEYDREEDIVVASLLDNLPWYKRILAKLVGANPTYVRIKGTVNITIDDHGKITKYSSDGLWEQMSFGNKKIVHINEYKGPTK